jgi:hypothetical protein
MEKSINEMRREMINDGPAGSSGKRVYIFNHIMKCGGTSFSSYLFNHLRCGESAQLYMLYTIDDFYKKWRKGRYIDAESIYVGGHFASEAHTLFPGHTPYYMTMLRDPLFRYLSSFKMSRDIGVLPEVDSPEEFFNGAWHNFMTLVIGDGDLVLAKKRLAEEYAFIGIIEEYEKSVKLLAHLFDLDAVAQTHANRSAAVVRKEDLSPRFIERYYEANADDVELYRFARGLFQDQWARHGDEIAKNPRPLVNRMPRIDIMAFVDGFFNDIAAKDSFVFEPWDPEKRHLALFWGILYRMSVLPLFYSLLKKGRYKDLLTALRNLKDFHESASYAHPLVARYIEFFERITPRGMRAIAGRLISLMKIDVSRVAKRSIGDSMPITSVGYLSFMDTDRMMRLSGAMENRENLKEKIELSLLDD